MSSWRPPPGMTGNAGLVRVSSRTARADEPACPASAAAKAPPGVWPGLRDGARRHGRPEFALGTFMTALDLIEHQQVPQGAAPERAAEPEPGRLAAHPGLIAWTRSALSCYLAAAPEMATCADESALVLCEGSPPTRRQRSGIAAAPGCGKPSPEPRSVPPSPAGPTEHGTGEHAEVAPGSKHLAQPGRGGCADLALTNIGRCTRGRSCSGNENAPLRWTDPSRQLVRIRAMSGSHTNGDEMSQSQYSEYQS